MLEGQKGWSVRCVKSEEGSYEMEETQAKSGSRRDAGAAKASEKFVSQML